MDVQTFCQEVITNRQELVFLSLNLPEIHKAFENNSVLLSSSGQLIATTTERIKKIKGKESWITLLSRFWTDQQIENNLSADQVDFPVQYFPDIPFEEAFFLFSEEEKEMMQKASEKAIFIIKTLQDAGIELPEKYLDII